ncbi:MAG: pyrophosphatase PpaX [Bacilli bacterium]|nr:pyrophosphatase PpaX [Bacilli bacterium]
MKNIDTILFDLDGTLIDTNEIIIKSFDSTFQKHLPKITLTRDKIISFIGPTLQETFGSYTKDPFLIQDMINSYRDFYVKYEVGNFEIYPDVLEVVQDLNNKGYNLGIVTSKFKVAAWPSFSFYDLQDYFQVFVALDDVKYPKPHRNPIDTALSRFPSYKKAIMIGDNQGDILAGKNAGIYGAGVEWSLKGANHLLEVNPDFMLSNMKDIYRIIKLIDEE